MENKVLKGYIVLKRIYSKKATYENEVLPIC